MIALAQILAATLFAAISIVSPKDGETVPLLRRGQRSYLKMARESRHKALGKKEIRDGLVAVGSDPQPVRLVWNSPTNATCDVTIADADGENEISIVLDGATSVYVTNLLPGRQYHWMVNCDGEHACAAFTTEDVTPRSLVAKGLANFRDMGGWKAEGGRRVLFNRIYRSAGLRNSSKTHGGGLVGGKVEIGKARVSEGAIAQIAEEFAIKTDVELRTRQECMGFERSLIDGAKWVHVPFVAYDLVDNLVRGKEPFAKLFRVFADKDNYPILMHCSGGRDRTGTVAFILNAVLGVSEEDLLRDWEYSAFSDSSLQFGPAHIARLLDYLNGLPGNTMRERATYYVQSCGVSDAEIESFRKIMLSDEK